jgi:HPt (histidine-containing phosphotransfer) domain-containing protein
MNGFLAKPVDVEKLESIVNEIAHKCFEREIRMPDPFAHAPQELESVSVKGNSLLQDKNIFNSDMLQSLKDTIGGKQLDDLLSELITKTEEILQEMQKATDQGDLATLAARAHELKGMAGNFGLVEISSLAAQAERKAKASDTSELDSLIGTLPEASLRAQSALKEWSTY